MSHFASFAAIDWSGARGERHRGIAVAIAARGRTAPQIVRPGHRWSRLEVLNWLRNDLPADTLVGLDLGISLPFADHGSFFPGTLESPNTAKSLWALIDAVCVDDPHLSANAFTDHPAYAPHFRRHGGRQGAHYPPGRGRLRRTEIAQARHGCKPYSNFNLVGAAQVGKSSLTGMRVLHGLDGCIPVWPFDDRPGTGSLIVEIYTTLAAVDAGRPASRSKMRTFEELNAALARLGSDPVTLSGPSDDHTTDALLTAVWLRAKADDQRLWHPEGLDDVRRTEGWTFGAL